MESISRNLLILALTLAGAIAAAKQDSCEWNLLAANDNNLPFVPVTKGPPVLSLVKTESGEREVLTPFSKILVTDEIRQSETRPNYDRELHSILQFFISGEMGAQGTIERWIVVPKNSEESKVRYTTRLDLQLYLQQSDLVKSQDFKDSLVIEALRFDLHISEPEARAVVEEYNSTLRTDGSRSIHLADCLGKRLAKSEVKLVVFDYDGEPVER